MSTMTQAADEMAAELVGLGRHQDLDGIDVRLHVMPSVSRRMILAVAEFPEGTQVETTFVHGGVAIDPDGGTTLSEVEQQFERELGRRLLSQLVSKKLEPYKCLKRAS